MYSSGFYSCIKSDSHDINENLIVMINTKFQPIFISRFYITDRGARLWSWSYGSWIYNYICPQYLSPLTLWVRISIRARCTTLCDKVCQWLATCRWFSSGLPVSPTNKTDRHDITEILLKVALSTIKQTNKHQYPFLLNNVQFKIIISYLLLAKIVTSTLCSMSETTSSEASMLSSSWASRFGLISQASYAQLISGQSGNVSLQEQSTSGDSSPRTVPKHVQ